ncbi:transcription elongation factor B, polypeptide 1 [[Emmonsia] crescens]|uniref:E3 ubiquitin ligase complex SCF subunit sconC n=1 Tax=[Emmonsia] crescens TaxID=73230 RepID=A0A2B7ZRF1_9EURO|nr:transcription elongation factor B, polypeptide 1 [Emmonsia crescens]
MSTRPSPPEFVTLASNDGFEFIIPRTAACVSGTIRRMLDPASNFSEAVTGRCVFEDMNGVVLEKVCEYFLYSHRNKDQNNVPDMEFPLELCLELLIAADYLDTGISRRYQAFYTRDKE